MDNVSTLSAKISIEHLTYRYPFAKNRSLEDITLSIDAGQSIGIIGRNGAGKSTLCYTLSGLIPRFFHGKIEGSIKIDGEDVPTMSVEKLIRKVGLVLQNPFSQISGAKMTVYEEVAFGLENLGIEKDEMHERIDTVLKQFDLYKKKDENPFELSGGQLQRLAIASVLALQPEILILDEPTSQLDPRGTTEVFEAISQLKTLGITVIIVEHKFEKLVEYVDKIALLNDGKLVEYDTAEKIFSMPQIEDYGVGQPIYTALCKRMGLKKPNGYYPVSFNETVTLLNGLKMYE
ncbi:MAG TPA: ABC transporter ATP-binding protein [Fervidobacterium sp.]|nr:ABC transporter ATP-binding protein [Fervidobacterium sp.]HPT54642.1 ABC transporter ATP-binding protein [Fervidobacterium sp.]HPZ17863.1 ABC transporter ATP-binding protein [Fervidobacterium sp.]HQE48938.1 ABC transporter ATP-binding protein [Fervidobacterium sp.]HUM42754.1 ABC transporter ATP-binding protein [Fervidobacterium sp.]